ncbi:tetratricopeptide repeat protein [Kitasatospora purpeofusca]|uniref:tetratricopeptide repeat protein n=1 Tax=Kitasatospora purpeofusca TaxID=67352 RepID=UPI0035E044FA
MPDLANALNNLSVRLGDAGRGEEALTAAQEAVAIRRTLAEANPNLFGTALQQSLVTAARLEGLDL